MSSTTNSARTIEGYERLHTSKLLVPESIALSYAAENQAADEIWVALRFGTLMSDADIKSHSDDNEEDDFEADTPAQSSLGGTVQEVDAAQLLRLNHVINRFAKRSKRSDYSLGQIQADDDAQPSMLELVRREEGGAAIVNVGSESNSANATGFGKRTGASKKQSEHNTLDLFVRACQMVPGFCEATSRERLPNGSAVASMVPIPPIPYSGSEPPLRFDPPLLGHSEIKPSAINNSLILGGTGSGKTASFLEPALKAMLEYRIDGKSATVLVIDPKVELLAFVERKLAELGEQERLVVIGQCPPVQYFQESDDLTLEDRYAVARKFVAEDSKGEDARWSAMADRLIIGLLKDSENFGRAVGTGLLESMAAIATGDTQFFKRSEWFALRKLLILGMEGQAQICYMSDLHDVLCFGVGLTNLDRPFARYSNLRDEDQYFYNARGALLIVDVLGGDDIEPIIDLSVRRSSSREDRCNIADLMERGAVIVFQPRPKATHDLMGAALKSLFFRCTMERRDMTRPIGLFYDEAQRFITVDEETGEHAFFDRCRAYRVNAFMATQSMAALQAAVSASPTSRSALDSILVNTPTKVCFKTTDSAALGIMTGFIPPDPSGLGHVLSARPPSSLMVGECYFSLGHEWGRTRYQLGVVRTSGTAANEDNVLGEAQ
jgi:hypothetical protein